jgi:hypothetical protein
MIWMRNRAKDFLPFTFARCRPQPDIIKLRACVDALGGGDVVLDADQHAQLSVVEVEADGDLASQLAGGIDFIHD